MKIIAAVTMVVLVSVEGCKVDNIDRAEVSTVTVDDAAECETAAQEIDRKFGVRAFCLPDTDQ